MRYATLIVLAMMVFIVSISGVQASDASKYVPIPTLGPVYYGIVEGQLRCADNTLTPTVYVTNDAVPNSTRGFPIGPSGNFEIELIPGDFTLTLPAPTGNGGQTETSHVTVRDGQISRPETELLGHASSGFS